MPVIINDVEDTEDTIEAPETPKQPQPPTRQMSNDEMIAMAIMSLATPLLGGMMGGKHGAQAGAVAGLKGAGMVAQNAADEDKEAKAAAAKDAAYQRQRKDGIEDFTAKEKIKAELKPDPMSAAPKSKHWVDSKGNTREGVIGSDGRLIQDEAKDVIVKPASAPKAAPTPKVPDNAKTEDGLRRDRDKHSVTKRTNALETTLRAMKGTKESAAGDISLIFQFMKMNDPDSAVREGEYATAQNSGGVADSVRNAYNKALSGERLTSDQRKDFIGQAEALVTSQRKIQKDYDKGITGIAERRGVNPENVIINAFPEEQPAAPQLSAEDAAALEWANSNPNDPRAAAIKQSLGAK